VPCSYRKQTTTTPTEAAAKTTSPKQAKASNNSSKNPALGGSIQRRAVHSSLSVYLSDTYLPP